MLDICLKLLAIFGILLLILLGLFLLVLLLVLFCPVTYRVRGRRDTESMELSVKIKWLAGFISARYRYPDPGRMKVKLLCFPLYDMKIPPDKAADAEKGNGKASSDETAGAAGASEAGAAEKSEDKYAAEAREAGGAAGGADTEDTIRKGNATGAESTIREGNATGTEDTVGKGNTAGAEDTVGKGNVAGAEDTVGPAEKASKVPEGSAADDAGNSGTKGKSGKLFEKIKKIKYTIQGIYDKIKRIWENISYYTALLREEDTKELFAHAMHVSGRILKSIRPRRIKADIVFGTGSPDTTGYLYGAYCVMTASMRNKAFLVTPDFERRIFQGEFDLAGHVCMGILLLNGLQLLMDKKLHIFIGKIKKNQRKEKQSNPS